MSDNELKLEFDPPAFEPPEPNLNLNETTFENESSTVSTIAPGRPDNSMLSESEKAMVRDFTEKIDINNTSQIMQYGGAAQKKIAGFSEQVLSNVRTKDMSEVGTMITGLVSELSSFSPGENKKTGFFRKQQSQLANVKAKYDTVEKNVDKICSVLEKHKIILLKDVGLLDQMYEKNIAYYKELTMYIIAGREKLYQITTTELPKLEDKARSSARAEDAQAANDLAEICNRFDKKLHDLELTRMVSIQMSPQIRMVQSTNNLMIEKIQSSLVNTIPLWKNQMVLALGMQHSESAIKAQREVTDITNKLLKKNADALKMNTIGAAKEAERSIIDIETLRHTNQSLITTLDEVLKIQEEGRQKRRSAEAELGKIENELKAKLLDMRDRSKSVNK